jgi:hypothetical protein
MAEDAVLQDGEGMLDRRPSQPHERGSSALVHAVQRVVMEMACDHALRRGSAQSPAGAASAVRCCSLVVDRAVLARQLLAHQRLARGAEQAVGLRPIREGAAVQQAARVDRACCSNMRDQSGFFTAAGLLAVGVAGVGDDVEEAAAQCFFARLRPSVPASGCPQHPG